MTVCIIILKHRLSLCIIIKFYYQNVEHCLARLSSCSEERNVNCIVYILHCMTILVLELTFKALGHTIVNTLKVL